MNTNNTMNTMRVDAAVLVLVDYQARLMPAIHQAQTVVGNALLLADIAQALRVPVLGTEQNPQGLGPNLTPVRERCTSTLAKMHFDACCDGLLEAIAALAGATQRDIVMAGCEAHVCLMQTALGLLRAGHRVWVVETACGARSVADKALAMARLQIAGATLVSVEMVAFEWLHTCRHEDFKTVLGLLKSRTVHSSLAL